MVSWHVNDLERSIDGEAAGSAEPALAPSIREPALRSRREVMRGVNVSVHKYRRLDASSVRYFCECENRGCCERVSLAPQQFEGIVADAAGMIISTKCTSREVGAAKKRRRFRSSRP